MSDAIWKRDEIDSPCVSICAIDDRTGLCTGCLRRRDEIARWSEMAPDERRAIMAGLEARRPLLARRRGGRKGRLQGG